jgi:chemotaxis protein MotB
MQEAGLRSDQVSQVRGFADQRLLMKGDPTNPSNRRISSIVRNLQIDAQEEQAMRSVSPENKPASQPPATAPAPAAPQTAARPAH